METNNEQVMDLAAAFDDNPADALEGEREEKVVKPKKAAPSAQAAEVEEPELELEGEEGSEGEGEGEEGEGEGDEELELVEGEGEEDEPVDLKDDVKLVLTINGKQVEKTLGQLRADAQKYEASEETVPRSDDYPQGRRS
jgi:hypothetical protein